MLLNVKRGESRTAAGFPVAATQRYGPPMPRALDATPRNLAAETAEVVEL